ncbi:MAG TPA: hypothetical protein VLI65_09060 [Pyrinomonadaceae bacterium]|nr:hypothetical protein [Pyrinomonadaceae bacterium]
MDVEAVYGCPRLLVGKNQWTKPHSSHTTQKAVDLVGRSSGIGDPRSSFTSRREKRS